MWWFVEEGKAVVSFARVSDDFRCRSSFGGELSFPSPFSRCRGHVTL
jgi:hypothetical protein